MDLVSENIYHIYNRGNDGEKIFFSRQNYSFFLQKIQNHILSQIDILCYCLMPNHFHLMVHVPLDFNDEVFKSAFKVMLSSYTRAINVQEKKTGSLFQQHTKAKCLSDLDKSFINYHLICFNYIHLNPLRSGLVQKTEEWEFSSFRDYLGMRKESFCNMDLARQLIELPVNRKDFYKMSHLVLDDGIENLF